MISARNTAFSAKRRIDPRKAQFAKQPEYQIQEYANRLNFYLLPPTAEVSLEQFEEWAISRLKVLSELETCTFRNRTPEETLNYMKPLLEKHLPLHANSSQSSTLQEERRKDQYSHFILRLAFSATEDLRRRFSRLETMLFRLRYKQDDSSERKAFINSLDFTWVTVSDSEKEELYAQLVNATGPFRKDEKPEWFKIDWEQVPDLVEQRKVYLKAGMAYVSQREQISLVVTEFTKRLDQNLEMTARALPRLDEDDRLSPILTHLSRSFATPDASYDSSSSLPSNLQPNAANVDALAQHFPLCMSNLHTTLRANAHLKHYGRLQYTLFLKGLGLSLEDCIIFWRRSFRLMTDEKFNKEYKYNIRHAYGDVGGDSNRRGRGYTPYSCQKLLTEAVPSGGQQHGCPYRTFSPDNLVSLLQGTGISDRDVIKDVKDLVKGQRYHVACNRVFEHAHKKELKRVKEEKLWKEADLDTILHPNTYFKRSFLLKHLDDPEAMEGQVTKQD
jgi:DNA primase large subunit